jgi:hypothetical protein
VKDDAYLGGGGGGGAAYVTWPSATTSMTVTHTSIWDAATERYVPLLFDDFVPTEFLEDLREMRDVDGTGKDFPLLWTNAEPITISLRSAPGAA